MDGTFDVSANGAAPHGAPCDLSTQLQKCRGMYIALLAQGKPIKLTGDSLHDFMPTFQTTSLARVNFAVNDLEKEGTEIAAKMGSIDTIVFSLLEGYYS